MRHIRPCLLRSLAYIRRCSAVFRVRAFFSKAGITYLEDKGDGVYMVLTANIPSKYRSSLMYQRSESVAMSFEGFVTRIVRVRQRETSFQAKFCRI